MGILNHQADRSPSVYFLLLICPLRSGSRTSSAAQPPPQLSGQGSAGARPCFRPLSVTHLTAAASRDGAPFHSDQDLGTPVWGTPPPPAGQLAASSMFVESLGPEGLTSETCFGFHPVSSHRRDNASTSFSLLADQCEFSTEVKLLQLPMSTRPSSKGGSASSTPSDYTSTASGFGTWLPKSQGLSLGVGGPGVGGRGRGESATLSTHLFWAGQREALQPSGRAQAESSTSSLLGWLHPEEAPALAPAPPHRPAAVPVSR